MQKLLTLLQPGRYHNCMSSVGEKPTHKKKNLRWLRITLLIISIGALNVIETNPEMAASDVSSPAVAPAISGFVIYGSAILSLWLFIEILAGTYNLIKKIGDSKSKIALPRRGPDESPQ